MEFLAFCQSNVSRSPREVPDYASYKKKQKQNSDLVVFKRRL